MKPARSDSDPAADRPWEDEQGVDLTLIRESLARTPEERLEILEAAIADLEDLRELLEPAPGRP
ncbi:MAG: hypothetical protein JNK60_08320 [Acidobacteria bacterium]|nr:hypothetical protein [Acidobacteriota bacterium]